MNGHRSYACDNRSYSRFLYQVALDKDNAAANLSMTSSKAPEPAPVSSGSQGRTPALQRKDWIAGLGRGVAVLEAFDAKHPRLTATDVGRRAGMTRTAARRFLLTWQHLGFVAGNGKMYWLTPRVLRLGKAYLESARLPRLVQPYLQRITTRTSETAYLSVLDRDDVLYIARNGPNRNMNTGYILGARAPAQVTAAGMLLLAMRPDDVVHEWLQQHVMQIYTPQTIATTDLLWAEFQRIRANGWALVEQQLDLNVRGVAVPLRDRHGTVVGALSITMPIRREKGENAVARTLPALRETAQVMRDLI